MGEDTYKPLLMGFIDDELTETEAHRVEEHLKGCPACAREVEEFRRLKSATKNMRVVMPSEREWELYWSSVYNRIERRIGWILVSVGAVLLASYGLYYLIHTFLLAGEIPIVVRIGIIALVVGFCTLIVSAIRERMVLSRSDKYERIKR